MKNDAGTNVVARAAEDETRKRLMAAALRCISRWGVDKTGLHDIAKEAGCARQTVYNHFPNAEAVIFAALFDASETFVGRLRTALRAYERPGDRILEAMMFCLAELPKEPFLQLVALPEFAPLANHSLFRAEATWTVLRSVAEECLSPERALARHTDELAEAMTRLLFSLLTLEAPTTRTEAETRAFLERWLLVPLGLRATRIRTGRGLRSRSGRDRP